MIPRYDGRKCPLYRHALTRELFMSLPFGAAYLAGPDLLIEFANDAWRRLADDRAIAGRPLREAMPELAGHERLERLKRSLETGESCHAAEAEVVLQRPGAQARHLFVDLFCQPVRDTAGAIAGVAVYAIDVTSHVRSRDGLAAASGDLTAVEERFRALFEATPQGIIHCDADGAIIEANHAASEILGVDLTAVASWFDIPGREVLREDGSPFPVAEQPVFTALRTGEIVTGVVVGVSYGPAEELRWLLVTAIPSGRDEQGRPSQVYVTFSDLTELWRAEIALRRGTAWLGRLRDANVLAVVVTNEECVCDANDAFLDLIGYSRDDLEAGRIFVREITPPDWAGTAGESIDELRRTGVSQPFEKEYIRQDGRRVPVLAGSVVIDRDPLRWTSFVVDLTARQRAEEERADLLVRARAHRAEAEIAEERLSVLLRAGALVAAGRDRDELLDEATRLLVPGLADICVVFLPTAAGTLRTASISAGDPSLAETMRELRSLEIPLAGPTLPQRVYAARSTQFSHDFAVDAATWTRAEDNALRLLRPLRLRTTVGTPLQSPDGPLGVIMVSRSADRPQFDAEDVQLFEELSRRLAVGIANADTFAREHSIAQTLQKALLPTALPRLPGVELAVRYLPATVGAEIGGDWYDGFPLPDGRIALVIGDVIGHSITSASIMGQVRNMIRGYAMDNPAPDHVLRQTNMAVAHMLPDALASAVYAVLDPATGDFDYANAGHPPPLASTDAGTAEYLDDTDGVVLGADAGTAYGTRHRRLQPGTRLLFYTDGLIEDRHRDISDGLAILAGALLLPGPLSAEQACVTAGTTLLGTRPRYDDVCLLAARLDS